MRPGFSHPKNRWKGSKNQGPEAAAFPAGSNAGEAGAVLIGCGSSGEAPVVDRDGAFFAGPLGSPTAPQRIWIPEYLFGEDASDPADADHKAERVFARFSDQAADQVLPGLTALSINEG